ncbi:MAG: GvpL/GvpF family gas vesicle protein [Hyphomicrobiaceae bacterium]|nr:MAG: GvpL/GvpF family gas vesicle protein [Hyphomicrobiaceae bacterium]
MLYVYAITDRHEEPLPSQPGLGDEKLTQIVWRDVAAIASVHDGSLISATADKVWRHEQVLEALLSERAVLPVRFGTLFASRQQVGEILCRAHPALVADMARIRGHVEIGVSFLPLAEREPAVDTLPRSDPAAVAGHVDRDSKPGLGPAATAPGTAYLRARLVRERARRDRRQVQLGIVRKACGDLAEHASASKLDDGRADRPVVSAAFLVQRDRLMSFRQAVARLAEAHPELALLCTGAWPPYSFVTAHVGESATGGGHDHAE